MEKMVLCFSLKINVCQLKRVNDSGPEHVLQNAVLSKLRKILKTTYFYPDVGAAVYMNVNKMEYYFFQDKYFGKLHTVFSSCTTGVSIVWLRDH